MNETPRVTIDLLARMLGVDPEIRPHRLLAAARQQKKYPILVLSAARAEGIPLGTGSNDELAGAIERCLLYQSIADDFASYGARTLKGTRIGEFYPEPLQRPQRDLDLTFPDSDTLWRAARTLVDRYPVFGIDLSFLCRDGVRHSVVSIYWPAADVFQDADYSVDLSTAAYFGNFGSVGVRVVPPADQRLTDLLAIAEERFQRKFTGVDALDLLFLLGGESHITVTELVEAASAYQLAPELRELAVYTRSWAELAEFLPKGLISALQEPAEVECARRAQWIATDDNEDNRTELAATHPDRIESAFSSGRPIGALLLKRRNGDLTEHFLRFSEGIIARTAVGDFLLVDGSLVEPEIYEESLRYIEKISE